MVKGAVRKSRLYIGMRNFYFETHDEQGQLISNETEHDWRVRVGTELQGAEAMELAYVFHDRDLDSQGDRKALHVHFVARFANPVHYEATRQKFKCEARNFEPGRSEPSALLYLTHTTVEAIKAKKTRYEVADLNVWVAEESGATRLTGEELEEWYRVKIAGKLSKNKVNTDEVVAGMIKDLAEGNMSLSDARVHLLQSFDETTATMAWVKNIRHFKTAVTEYYDNKYLDWLESGRDFQLVYIQGQSGIGKTRFANQLARKFNEAKGFTKSSIHNAPNESKGARYDFLNTYNNEAVTVFDDLDPKTFGYTEFLNLFERERVSKYSSRFNDKAWFAELAIITKSTTNESWTAKLSYGDLQQARSEYDRNNTLYQPRRRFSLVLDLRSDGVKISRYELTNKRTNEHKLVQLEFVPCQGNFHDKDFQERALERVGVYLGLTEPSDEEVALLEVVDGETL